MIDLVKYKIRGSMLLEACFAIVVFVSSVGVGMRFMSDLFYSPSSLNEFKAIQDMKAHIYGYTSNNLIEIEKTEVKKSGVEHLKCKIDLKRAYSQQYSIMKRK